MKELLIIFIKNPVKGKVKTRLAKSIGDEAALNIYLKLLRHTMSVASETTCDKVVYYSDFIPSTDQWSANGFMQELQRGHDLGERMLNAFETSFQKGYSAVCIIGSDCYDLSSDHLALAFEILRHGPFVVGPAKDGGYYLLGMNKPCEAVFKNKQWSTATVCEDTLRDLHAGGIAYEVLPTLSDIDNETDLAHSKLRL